MKKIKDFVKKNYKVAISFVLGMIVCIGIGVSAVATKDVVYDNSKSGLSSTNLQGAIDELNTKATTKINEAKKECPEGKICQDGTQIESHNSNIVAAYTYNSSTCITGEESTCEKNNCVDYSNVGACLAGTIVKYKVNSSTTKYFYILYDDGETMTMQQIENTVGSTAWNSSGLKSDGPIVALSALESATAGWTNVNNQTYKMGTTVFKGSNYTGCTSTCSEMAYTLPSRTAKARMITAQEAYSTGCEFLLGSYKKTCPTWMITGSAYWTMSGVNVTADNYAVDISPSLGNIAMSTDLTNTNNGARAVVVVNK